jgi:diguanylate cyclase (GGDEF)-like protein
MPNFQPHSQGALFTPEEIRVLMAAEFDRSVRFKTPLCLLRIAIDRIGYLHDLYGEESKLEILTAVNGLLRSKTRASDLLGFPFGNHIIAAVPHIQPEHATALAGRLVSGARGLTFDTDGRTLRITASIGLAHTDTKYKGFEAMLAGATSSLDAALAAGGDRFVLHVPEPEAAATEPAPPIPAAAPEAPAAGADALLAETLRRALAGEGPTDLAQGLLSRVLDELEQRFAAASGDERTDLLERRVAKLGAMLERTEERLRHVLQNGGDDGVASIYRDVQGLDAGEGQFEHKRDLLKAIFDANLRMQRMRDEETT